MENAPSMPLKNVSAGSHVPENAAKAAQPANSTAFAV